MSSMYEQTLATHTWTPLMDKAQICGECPACMTEAQPVHIEFSGGDGERGFVEYECDSCDTHWTDSYNLVTRTVYPADTREAEISRLKARLAELCSDLGDLEAPEQPREASWDHGLSFADSNQY